MYQIWMLTADTKKIDRYINWFNLPNKAKETARTFKRKGLAVFVGD